MSETERDVTTNAGRCDICGQTVDMRDAGDTLTLIEFPSEEATEHGFSDQEVADAVADALESVGDSGADYELAKVIREEHSVRAHDACLEDTNYSMLETAEGV